MKRKCKYCGEDMPPKHGKRFTQTCGAKECQYKQYRQTIRDWKEKNYLYFREWRHNAYLKKKSLINKKYYE